MVIEVELPDGSIGEFPDNFSNEQIESVLSNQFGGQQQPVQDQGVLANLGLVDPSRRGQPGLASGIVSGLENVGLGAQQRLAEAGFAPIKQVLKQFKPELAEEIESFTPEDINQIITQRVAEKKAQPQTTLESVGEFVGEVLPIAGAIPVSGLTGAGLAGAAIGAATPTEKVRTPEQSLQQAAIEGAIGVGTAGTFKAIPQLSKTIKNLSSKALNVNKGVARDFEDAGVQATLAQISDSGVIKYFDRVLAKFPGSASRINKATERTVRGIEDSVLNLQKAPSVSAEEAGEIIKVGAGRFVDKFKGTSTKLFNRLDKFIPSETSVAGNAISKLANENLAIIKSSSPQLAQRLGGREGIKILDDILSDVQAGLKYSDLKNWRTLVGNKLTNALVSGENQAVLKQIYGALSKDMRNVAISKGDKALRAFDKTNDFYRRGIEQIEGKLSKIVGNQFPERVFENAISGSKIGATKIKDILKTLDGDERDILRSTVVKRFGLAAPGRQDVTGELFSPQTFVTNYSRMSSTAKDALFGVEATGYRKSLDQIVKMTDSLNKVGRTENFSNTGQHLILALLGVGGIATGSLGVVSSLVVSANVLSRLMTNPSFVKWVAGNSAAKTPGAFAKSISNLKQVAKNNPDIADDVLKYIGVLSASVANDR